MGTLLDDQSLADLQDSQISRKVPRVNSLAEYANWLEYAWRSFPPHPLRRSTRPLQVVHGLRRYAYDGIEVNRLAVNVDSTTG